MAYDIFELKGTPAQNEIILEALRRSSSFPFEKLKAELESEKGRLLIPVEWADLGSYGANAKKAKKAAQTRRGIKVESLDPVLKAVSDEHPDHDHAGAEEGYGHLDVKQGDDEAHGIAYRNRVLGLAWYSGKVSIDLSLESNPEVAMEVFLSEAAHMIDFFYMTDEHRKEIFNAFHGSEDDPAPHGDAWFDSGDYYTWVGEAFMGGFVTAYSDIPVTIAFTHSPTEYTSKRIREILTPELVAEPTQDTVSEVPVEPETPEAPAAEEPVQGDPVAPEPEPDVSDSDTGVEEPKTPEEEPKPEGPQVVSSKGGIFFHLDHEGASEDVKYSSKEEALEKGKLACPVCNAS